jgi:hypothetical protein
MSRAQRGDGLILRTKPKTSCLELAQLCQKPVKRALHFNTPPYQKKTGRHAEARPIVCQSLTGLSRWWSGRRRTVPIVRTARAARSSTGAATSATAQTTTPAARPHVLQLLELLGCEDLLKLRSHVRLHGIHLLLLVSGQVEPLARAGRQDVNPVAAGSGLRLRRGRLLRRAGY